MEYKILKSDSLINEGQLTRLALEGWQLITIVSDKQSNNYYFYFSRAIDPI